jgi:hypothetical protein
MRGQPARNVGAESKWLVIDTAEPGYAPSVVTLVARIARTPSGRAILEGIRASGGSVKIEKPAPTDPPNATVGRESSGQQAQPEDPAQRPDLYLGFDPQDWPSPFDAAARSPEVVLFVMLREALARLCAGPDAASRFLSRDAAADAEEAAAVARFQQERNPR